MKKLEALTTVYSYMYPEVRRVLLNTLFPSIIEEVSRNPHNNGMVSMLKNDSDFLALLERVFASEYLSKLLQQPNEMDAMHIPIIQKYVDLHSASIPGLNKFPYRYPTAGSEEGIREVMTHLLAQGVEDIYVLKGEYEGYNFLGQTRGYKTPSGIQRVKTVEIDPEKIKPIDLKPGWFFISNPSARDGNVIPEDFLDEIRKAGHLIFYDLAYADSTNPKDKFDLNHENDRFAVVSFSKPYGLFYFRAGFAFSKDEIPSLYGNKWFKVVPSLLVADKIMDKIKPGQLFTKYRPVQEAIVEGINQDFGLGIRVSDALLLGHLTGHDAAKLNQSQLGVISTFKRGDGYRFCLKPYYEKIERERSLNSNL